MTEPILRITLAQLADLPEGSFRLIDIRDEVSFEYGTMQGAENMPDIVAER